MVKALGITNEDAARWQTMNAARWIVEAKEQQDLDKMLARLLIAQDHIRAAISATRESLKEFRLVGDTN